MVHVEALEAQKTVAEAQKATVESAALCRDVKKYRAHLAEVRSLLQELRRLFIQCKDLKILTISTPRYV